MTKIRPAWKVAAVGGALIGLGVGVLGTAQAATGDRPPVEGVNLGRNLAAPDAPVAVATTSAAADTTIATTAAPAPPPRADSITNHTPDTPDTPSTAPAPPPRADTISNHTPDSPVSPAQPSHDDSVSNGPST